MRNSKFVADSTYFSSWCGTANIQNDIVAHRTNCYYYGPAPIRLKASVPAAKIIFLEMEYQSISRSQLKG